MQSGRLSVNPGLIAEMDSLAYNAIPGKLRDNGKPYDPKSVELTMARMSPLAKAQVAHRNRYMGGEYDGQRGELVLQWLRAMAESPADRLADSLAQNRWSMEMALAHRKGDLAYAQFDVERMHGERLQGLAQQIEQVAHGDVARVLNGNANVSSMYAMVARMSDLAAAEVRHRTGCPDIDAEMVTVIGWLRDVANSGEHGATLAVREHEECVQTAIIHNKGDVQAAHADIRRLHHTLLARMAA